MTTPAPALVLPPDVQAVPPLAERIRAHTYPGMPYKCVRCQHTGQLGDGRPVTVDVHGYGGGLRQVRVAFLHEDCGTGGLVDHANAELTLPDELDAFAVPILVRGPLAGRPWPAVVVELSSSLFSTPLAGLHGDVDVLTAALLRLGLHLVGNVCFPPEPPDPRWRVTLPGDDEPGDVRGPEGLVLFRPLNTLTWPPDWAPAAAARGGRCLVFHVARIGRQTRVATATADAALQLLNTAARDGRVVGVIATVAGRR